MILPGELRYIPLMGKLVWHPVQLERSMKQYELQTEPNPDCARCGQDIIGNAVTRCGDQPTQRHLVGHGSIVNYMHVNLNLVLCFEPAKKKKAQDKGCMLLREQHQ